MPIFIYFPFKFISSMYCWIKMLNCGKSSRELQYRLNATQYSLFDNAWSLECYYCKTILTWDSVSLLTWSSRGMRRSGQMVNTSLSWSTGSCSSTWKELGFVRWQHRTNPSHTFFCFHTWSRTERWYHGVMPLFSMASNSKAREVHTNYRIIFTLECKNWIYQWLEIKVL